MNERDLLAAAKDGDEAAFETLIAPFRRELQAHAYRMLGSVVDAEDVLQEALLGAWRGLPRFEGRSSLRSWLYTITTNAALKAIRQRPKRVLPVDYGPAADPHDPHDAPLTESVWIEPVPDEQLFPQDEAPGPEERFEQLENIELAFVAALQHLPARQRAVLILRDVLGFSARETAEMMDATPASVDSALQRAHKAVDERLPERSQQETLRSLGDDELRKVVDGYVAAFESTDIDALASMLAEEATLAMPPMREWFSGRDAIAEYFGRQRERQKLKDGYRRFLPTSANGQPATGHYVWDEDEQAYLPHAIHVLGLRGDRIQEITVFLAPEVFDNFGLPERIERD